MAFFILEKVVNNLEPTECSFSIVSGSFFLKPIDIVKLKNYFRVLSNKIQQDFSTKVFRK